MSTITFRGAYIRYFDTRRNEGGQIFTRVYFSADWTDVVRNRRLRPLREALHGSRERDDLR